MKKRVCIFLLALALAAGVLGNGSQVQAAKVRLNMTKKTLTVGKTVTLKVKGTRKKVKWSSSNKKVASVSSKGKVKAKKAGKATITAKIGKKKYKCKITVMKKNTTNDPAAEQDKTTEKNAEETTEKPTDGTTEGTTEKSTEAAEQTTAPGEATTKYDAGEYSINKTHTGEGTYYDRVSAGAANLDDYEASYYTAAMNNEDYMNGLAGAFVEITDKDGDKINVLITDRLPEGKKGDIDLSRKAFARIEPLVTGRMNITWRIIPFPTAEPISYVFKPTSTQWWAEVQVRNGRYPIKKLEYYDNTAKKYVEMERQEYNYFTAGSGMGVGPYTFRVTDFYGHVLTDTNIFINTSSTPVKGKANFPY